MEQVPEEYRHILVGKARESASLRLVRYRYVSMQCGLAGGPGLRTCANYVFEPLYNPRYSHFTLDTQSKSTSNLHSNTPCLAAPLRIAGVLYLYKPMGIAAGQIAFTAVKTVRFDPLDYLISMLNKRRSQ